MDNESTHRVWEETQMTEVGKVSGSEGQPEATRDGLLAVLAEHSTDGCQHFGIREGGEVKPKRPTVGKAKPGTTFCVVELRQVHRDHKPYNHNNTECSG